jgi:hypothetical protein
MFTLTSGARDLRNLKTCLTCGWFFTSPSAEGILKLVLKRGTAPFSGGLISRLSLLFNILPRIVSYA